MSTALSVTQHYDATPERVFALFGDPEFLSARLRAGGGLDPVVVSQESDADSATLVTRQGIPASVLPSMVSNFIQGDPTTQRTETWTSDGVGGYTAAWSVTVKGAPASLKGAMSLVADGDGAVLTVTGNATVAVPPVRRQDREGGWSSRFPIC